MVWLTGGGNNQSSGQGMGGFGGGVYNGEQVAPEDVVFVSYNLRLGALGFLAHAALDGERPEKVSGNFSVLPRLHGPNVDGHVFPDQPIKLIVEKRHAAVPMIINATSGETGDGNARCDFWDGVPLLWPHIWLPGKRCFVVDVRLGSRQRKNSARNEVSAKTAS
jgi:carboxylesterase type B